MLLALLAAAQLQVAAAQPVALPTARANDNRIAAGTLKNGVLTLALEVRKAQWHPEGAKRVVLPGYVFAEKGREATTPGPLIRVPAGTELRITIANTLDTLVRIRGLQDHTTATLDTVDIAAGETRTLEFRVDVPGTYMYWGRTEQNLNGFGIGKDSQLHGGFIVDAAGVKPAANERVLIVSQFADSIPALGAKSEAGFALLRRFNVSRNTWVTFLVNGRAWPHTERMTYSVGDTVPFRVINVSRLPHPMHLHGFYFDVLSRGDANRDTLFTAAGRRFVVTEPMPTGATLRMRWIPTREGNWLFHCHLVEHIDAALRLDSTAGEMHHGNHAESGMAGLVSAIKVLPKRGAVQAGRADPVARRKLRLHVTRKPDIYRGAPGYSFVLQEGAEPAADSIRAPSSTLVLRRNEPTEITVVNRTDEQTTVHWHGIEVESYYDGVGDFSGVGMRLAPSIAPRDSFVVRMTPDRAGTFIYHTHTDESKQLTSGLYGALLVLDEKETSPDTTDRVFLLGAGGPQDDATPFVNGVATPPTIELRAGVKHRLRFVSIAAVENKRVRLLRDTTVQQWRAVAKDGAELRANQATLRAAVQGLQPGETYDFEVRRDAAEELVLEVLTGSPVRIMRIPVVVKP